MAADKAKEQPKRSAREPSKGIRVIDRGKSGHDSFGWFASEIARFAAKPAAFFAVVAGS